MGPLRAGGYTEVVNFLSRATARRKHPRPGLHGARRPWRLVAWDAARKWHSDEAGRLAAALSYYAAFSMAPMLLASVAVLSIILPAEAARGLMADRLATFLGPERAALIEAMAAGVTPPKGGGLAGLMGFAILIWGASNVVGELQFSLDRIFGVHAPARSHWDTVRHRLVAITFVLTAGVFMLASVFLGTAASAAGKFFGGALGYEEKVLQAFHQGTSFVVMTALFAAMFRWLPDARTSWRDLVLGAALTSALFTLGGFVVGLYLGKIGPTSAYGAVGGLLALLLWAYYTAQIVYLGAEFTQAYARGRGHGIRSRRPLARLR